jgi:hypothetical protein
VTEARRCGIERLPVRIDAQKFAFSLEQRTQTCGVPPSSYRSIDVEAGAVSHQ